MNARCWKFSQIQPSVERKNVVDLARDHFRSNGMKVAFDSNVYIGSNGGATGW